MQNRVELPIGQNNLIIETGIMAKQADGAVLVQYGGTVVLVSACISEKPRANADFFPLFVEYQEKTYAAGRIPGGFFKREGRPSEKEILTARLIDRPIRPLFPKGMFNEVQVIAIVLSSDGENDPDVLAMVGASSALMLANIPFADGPFKGPMSAVRVGKIGEEFVLNPTYAQIDESSLDLVVASSEEGIIMLEAGAKEVDEQTLVSAISFAQEKLSEISKLQYELQKKVKADSNKSQRTIELTPLDEVILQKTEDLCGSDLQAALSIEGKKERTEKIQAASTRAIEELVTEESGYAEKSVKEALDELMKKYIRKLAIDDGKRLGGRGFDQIRPIDCKANVLPRTHGSGLFTRGETQSLAVTTLGSRTDERMIEGLEEKTFKSFMLHYNFPPFSVGEVRPMRGAGRREIGHGALAERALFQVLPSKDEFPYTIRLVSEILESNGSSSMATVCAGTLALMDAGVPLKSPVSGIAMGLIKEGEQAVILTDILGKEDHFGDTDFKVAGTREGITAMQVDLKIQGIAVELIAEILAKAKQARLTILDKITEVIDKPRSAVSEFAPKIHVLKIETTKIGEVIGPGGKTIRRIIQQTGATIDIDDEGRVVISAQEAASLQAAIDQVTGLTAEPEIGKIYDGTVKKITAFGAFCEFMPNKEGLVHVSELSNKFIKNVEEVVKVGQEIKLKLIGIDDQGRVKLSAKQAQG